MEYAEYPFTPGGQHTQRAQDMPVGSGGAPSDFPPPGGNEPPPFRSAFGWSSSPTPPSGAPADPHDQPFEKSPAGTFEPLRPEGSLPANIQDHGGVPGPFSSTKPVWVRPSPQPDPHN